MSSFCIASVFLFTVACFQITNGYPCTTNPLLLWLRSFPWGLSSPYTPQLNQQNGLAGPQYSADPSYYPNPNSYNPNLGGGVYPNQLRRIPQQVIPNQQQPAIQQQGLNQQQPAIPQQGLNQQQSAIQPAIPQQGINQQQPAIQPAIPQQGLSQLQPAIPQQGINQQQPAIQQTIPNSLENPNGQNFVSIPGDQQSQ